MRRSQLGVQSTLLRCCLLTIFIAPSRTFNLHPEHSVVHRGPPASHFGYSVALHSSAGNNWLLVGAPLSQTLQPEVLRGGALYRCLPMQTGRCRRVNLDRTGNSVRWPGTDNEQREEKSGQWMGATVASAGADGNVLVCAPRYVVRLRSRLRDAFEPTGSCWLTNSRLRVIKRISPCENESRWGWHRTGHCMAGFSGHLAKDGETILLGAVGSWFWQGQIYSINYRNFSESYETLEGDEVLDSTYMGFSLASGNFDGDKLPDVVTGIPKATGYKGRISILSNNLTVITNLTGLQIGEYFGYSVAVADFNADGADDIAVGAPMFSANGVAEVGRVEVYLATGNKHFLRVAELFGRPESGARFGNALTASSDFNGDGLKDLVVGAPYGGQHSTGCLYVYLGKPNGITETYVQVIDASTIPVPSSFTPLASFGFSLAGGLDMDKNHYDDLLVGAYKSGHAIYLRSRPIVKLAIVMTSSPTVIDLKNQSCQNQNNISVSCLKLSTCFLYGGLNLPQHLDFRFNWTVDRQSLRLHHPVWGNRYAAALTLRRRHRTCIHHTLFLPAEVKDKLNDMVVAVGHELLENLPNLEQSLPPIIDWYTPDNFSTRIRISKSCGNDSICHPNLQVTVKSVKPVHVLGRKERVILNVSVINYGEDSYNSRIEITIPPELDYINIRNIETMTDVQCYLKNASTWSVILCDIGNPLPTNYKVQFQVLTMKNCDPIFPFSLNLTFLVSSGNAELAQHQMDNFFLVKVEARELIRLQLSGLSQPEHCLFSESYLNHKKPLILQHMYQVTNAGPSNASKVRLAVNWPISLGSLNILSEPNVSIKSSSSMQSGQCITLPDRKIGLTSEYNINKFHTLECLDSLCMQIICEVGPLAKQEEVEVWIASLVNTTAVMELEESFLLIKSTGEARLQHSHYSTLPLKATPILIFQVSTYVASMSAKPLSPRVHLWIIILAVISGILLFLLTSYILYKCGFFRRKGLSYQAEKHRVSDVPQSTCVGDTTKLAFYDSIPNEDL